MMSMQEKSYYNGPNTPMSTTTTTFDPTQPKPMLVVLDKLQVALDDLERSLDKLVQNILPISSLNSPTVEEVGPSVFYGTSQIVNMITSSVIRVETLRRYIERANSQLEV